MSMQDTIADMLTRLRNGQTATKKSVSMMASKLKVSILKVLQEEGYIIDYQVIDGENNKKSIVVELKYKDNKPVIELIKRVSRPGLRVYVPSNDLPKVYGGLGVAIVSTSKGVMTDREARRQGLGGELLCYVA